MGLSSDRPNFPDSGDSTRRTADKSTWSFHERYANDPEFKRQIDEGRVRARMNRDHKALKSALSMVQEKRKMY